MHADNEKRYSEIGRGKTRVMDKSNRLLLIIFIVAIIVFAVLAVVLEQVIFNPGQANVSTPIPTFPIGNHHKKTPTTLDMPWTCGDINSRAGMGTLVKQFLFNGT